MKLLFKQFLNEHCVLGLFNDKLVTLSDNYKIVSLDIDNYLDKYPPDMWVLGGFVWPDEEVDFWSKLQDKWEEWIEY